LSQSALTDAGSVATTVHADRFSGGRQQVSVNFAMTEFWEVS
jgi:hypothetical protein